MKKNIYRNTNTAITIDKQGNVAAISAISLNALVLKIKIALKNKDIDSATIYVTDGAVDFYWENGRVVKHNSPNL